MGDRPGTMGVPLLAGPDGWERGAHRPCRAGPDAAGRRCSPRPRAGPGEPAVVAVPSDRPLTRGNPPCPSPGGPSRWVLSNLDIPGGLGYHTGGSGPGGPGSNRWQQRHGRRCGP